MTCSKSEQPMPKATYHSGFHDKQSMLTMGLDPRNSQTIVIHVYATWCNCNQGRINASAGPGSATKMWAPPRWAHIFAFTMLTKCGKSKNCVPIGGGARIFVTASGPVLALMRPCLV